MGGIPIPHFAAANMEAMKSAMSQSNPALTKNASEPTVSSKISNIYKKVRDTFGITIADVKFRK